MSRDDFFAWLPLVVLVGMFVAGRVRAAGMRRRGVRAIVVDLRRPLGQRLYDTLMIGITIVWVYLLVAEAWPLSLAWLPGWLTLRVVDRLAVKLVGAALIGFLHGIIRREERFLAARFGDSFAAYASRVGRYSSWF